MKEEILELTPKRKSILWVYGEDGNVMIWGFNSSAESDLRGLFEETHDSDPNLTKENGVSVKLNGSASLIWEMCDGVNSVKNIIEALSQKYDTPKETVVQDVLSFLEECNKLNIIDLNWRCIE